MKKKLFAMLLILTSMFLTSCGELWDDFLNYMQNGPETAELTVYNLYNAQIQAWFTWETESGEVQSSEVQTLDYGKQGIFSNLPRTEHLKMCIKPYFYSSGSYEYWYISTMELYYKTYTIDYDIGKGGFIYR